MNVLQKLLLVSLGLAIANFNLSAAERREGESQKDFNERVRDQERKKEAVVREDLSLGDLFYLKKDGPMKFYTDWFQGLTAGKKITFIETWMQQGIDERSPDKMYEALNATADTDIQINPAIIKEATRTIKISMSRGRNFLNAVLPYEEAEKFGANIANIKP